MTSIILQTCLLLPAISGNPFTLVGEDQVATIVVPTAEPQCVLLAAQDLAGDVAKITGRTPSIVRDIRQAAKNRMLLLSANQPASAKMLDEVWPEAARELRDRWEAYRCRVRLDGENSDERTLVLAGSDERGTMFAAYTFCEQYLGVDPLYFWSDREPNRRDCLAWDEVAFASDGPDFHFRGWFINDEDLLTGWKPNPAQRQIPYKFYARILSPTVADHVYEAILRLRYNLIIPSSFIDIRNPDEAVLIERAVRRGLFVSMHHQEPLGVTGLYTFPNYWRDQGKQVPYSFPGHRGEFEQIWRDYVRLWSRYGDRVIWQLGLRGLGDRAVWETDPSAPKTNADRGQMISAAMELQRSIVCEIDPREHPPMTTTLWMEGAELHAKGHLQFPADVAVVFSDNSPGWKLQPDFFETPRKRDRSYGVYYHQALWETGPHFCQNVGPRKMQQIFSLAAERGDTYYTVINVSNVREFVLGLAASSRMLWDFESFDADAFLSTWCAERFGPVAPAAEESYRLLFDSLIDEAKQGDYFPPDGRTFTRGRRLLMDLLRRVEHGQAQDAQYLAKGERLLAETRRHRAKVEQAGQQIDNVLAGLRGAERQFFAANFVAQHGMLLNIIAWYEAIVSADLACGRRESEKLAAEAVNAQAAMQRIRRFQQLASEGKWRDWYQGDWLMGVTLAERMTQTLFEKTEPIRTGGGH